MTEYLDAILVCQPKQWADSEIIKTVKSQSLLCKNGLGGGSVGIT